MSELPFTQQELALIATVVAVIVIGGLVTHLLLRRPRPAAAMPLEALAFHQRMEPGREYVIIRAFTDFDGAERAVGERWTFRGYDFLPYDDGLTLFTDPGPGVRLQWRREAQAEIIENLGAYIAPA